MELVAEEGRCIEIVLAWLRNLTAVGVRELCDVILSLMEGDTPTHIYEYGKIKYVNMFSFKLNNIIVLFL